MKVVISFTVEQGSTVEQFKGIIALKNEEGDEIRLQYTWALPSTKQDPNYINIKFSNQNENFSIGKINFLLRHKSLTERQKIIAGLSIMIIPNMIDRMKKTATKIVVADTLYQEVEPELYYHLFKK